MSPTAPPIEVAVAAGDALGETPLWCERDRLLWWIDIERPRLQSFDPASGAHAVHPLPGGTLGCQALTVAGDRLLALDLGLQRFDPGTGLLQPFAEVEREIDNRLNDGRVDAGGRLWIGTLDNQLARPQAALYRVDPDGRVTRQVDGIVVTNGLAFAPDGRTLYFTDTRRYLSFAFDLDPDDGTLSNRRLFADHRASGDRPDGAAVDAEGCLWFALFAGGRLARYRPDGRLDRIVELPVTNPTCPCFGGPDLKTLYVTSARKFLDARTLAGEPLAGALLAIEGLGQGLPEHRFG